MADTGLRENGLRESGLREKKKAATRQALHEAALRLCVERGLDAVTVDAIADAANVSRRTFSNYFGSKEDALLHGDRMRVEELLETVRARPRAESPWQALIGAAADGLVGMRDPDPEWVMQLHLVKRHPALAAQQTAVQVEREQGLAAELKTRLPDEPDADLRARVIAGVFLAAIRAAMWTWLERDGRTPLADLILAGLRCAGSRFE